ncbi:MAG: AAA family ATPase [Novosphingobium sp.]
MRRVAQFGPATGRHSGVALADIFISYNRQDQLHADLFVRSLEAAGLSVWWDASLRAGEVYDEVTEAALRGAKAVVVMWSTRAVASRWVRAEATLAQRLGTFVPCMIEPCERPIMFELTQTADLIGWQGDEQAPAWQAFVGHVREVIEANRRKAGTVDALGDSAAPAPAPAARPSSERRQVTFLAGQIAEGQRMAMTLDPEDWHELLITLTPRLDAVAARLGGTIKWNAHRFSAVFGYPVAHEDAAQRAIRAALGMVEAAARDAQVPEGWSGGAPRLQLGIHTGDVLVTASGQGEAELFGEGSALATMLRDRAQPGEVLVSETVRQLAGRDFALDPAGGDEADDAAYSVRGMAARSIGRKAEAGRQTQFVGREDELQVLCSRWRRAEGGASQVVLVRGEPGIGKTRLVEEFRSGLDRDRHFWITLQGSSMFPNTPYHAVGQMAEALAEEAGIDPAAALAARIEALGLAPGLGQMILAASGLQDGTEAGLDGPAGDQQRRRMRGALIQAVFELAERRPVVMLIDDLQWIDPSTLEVVEMLIEQADQDAILVLATARPEFQPPWPENEHHSRLTLGRLAEGEVRRLVGTALAEQGLPPEAIEQVVARADGVPLFAEELARMSAGTDAAVTLPSTLRALLAARMDRLGQARELLQVGAVLGRSFSWDLLARVSGRNETELGPMLELLVDEQLLIVRGAAPAAQYRFKHALLQDAAYDVLPKKRQRELHRLAARTIVDEFPDLVANRHELVASHWTRAGAAPEAIAAWTAAGDAANRRAAVKEAAAHYRSALALIGKLPEDADRDSTELSLWSKLNRALQFARGYADPETVAAAAKAVALAKRGGVLGRVLAEEAQLWGGAITAGSYDQADAIARQVVELAAQLGPGEAPPWIAYFEANARIQTGFYAGRIKTFEPAWTAWREAATGGAFKRSPGDAVISIGVGSLAAWMAGRSDLARARIEEALTLAASSGQPYALAVAHHFAGTLTAFERDRAATLEHSRRAVEVCEANGYEYILHLARAKLGWAGSAETISGEDIQAMRHSLEQMIESNALVGMILNMNRLAIALEGAGRLDEAIEVTDRTLALNPQERVALPQTYEIRGCLFRMKGDAAAALSAWREGIALAAELGTIALELSLAVHLARALADGGASAEARAVIDRTLARCDAQTNSPDLEPVRALAAELTAAA